MGKYAKLDTRLFKWLSENKKDATTARVFKALRISEKRAAERRHISRRFTQLEHKGVLVCKLNRTQRVCRVVKALPKTLAKKKWSPRPKTAPSTPPAVKSIQANNSIEFEMAGGRIERLQSHWDKPAKKRAIGSLTFLDTINALD